MSLDFSDKAIAAGIDEVRAPNGANDWVVLGHQGTTNKIKVVEKGKGFDDLLEELNNGKILYIYKRFHINDMDKFLFVTWVPDGVTDMIFKGNSRTFIRDFENYLKGKYHLQVNARNENDLDEEEIKKKLKVASGALYTSQNVGVKAVTVDQAKTSITSKPQPAVPARDKPIVDKSASDQFWQQEQKRMEEERQRKEKEAQKPTTIVDKSTSSKFWEQQQKEKEAEEKKQPATTSTTVINKEASNKFWAQQAETTTPAPTATTASGVKSGYAPTSDAAKPSSLRAKFEQMATKEPEPTIVRSTNPKPFVKPVAPVQEPPVKPTPPAVDVKPTAPAADIKPTPPAAASKPTPPAAASKPTPPAAASKPTPPSAASKPVAVSVPEPEPEPVQEPVHPEPEPEPEPEPQQEVVPEPEPEPAQEHVAQEEQVGGDGEMYGMTLYPFVTEDPEELPFEPDQRLRIITSQGDWWTAEYEDGSRRGYVPSNYIQLL